MRPVYKSKPLPIPQKITEWRKHWLKIVKDNPHLETNRARNKKANEEWLKLHPPKKYVIK